MHGPMNVKKKVILFFFFGPADLFGPRPLWKGVLSYCSLYETFKAAVLQYIPIPLFVCCRFVCYFLLLTFSKFNLASSKCRFNTSSSSCVNSFSSCLRPAFSLLSVLFLHKKLLNLTILFPKQFLSIISDIVCRTNIYFRLFLGAFSKLRKAAVSFIMSVCHSSNMGQLGYHRKDFYEI